MTIRECYTVLELEPGASLEDAKKAYKLLAAVWHPDRFTNNPKLREQAQQKLKRINEAYDTLKQHFEQGGTGQAADDSSSDPAPEQETYVDSQCWYLSGDPRLQSVSAIERGRRPALLRVGSEGITVATLGESGVDETIHYAAETIHWLNEQETKWVSPDVSFDEIRDQEHSTLEADRVELCATDSEEIVQGFVVSLRFRNEYFCKLFQKRVCERFRLNDATKQFRTERRERDQQRQREARAEQEIYEKFNLSHALGLAFFAALVILIIILIAVDS